jgi:hypothetical protein
MGTFFASRYTGVSEAGSWAAAGAGENTEGAMLEVRAIKAAAATRIVLFMTCPSKMLGIFEEIGEQSQGAFINYLVLW